MAYKLSYDYRDIDFQIAEIIDIQVYETEFIVDCDHSKLKKDIINFLEYFDMDLIELNSQSLKEILDSEFKIR